ncbi:MAG TPA: 3-oxoacyl-ACP reductase family protein [Candidatus Aquilonibacter sp.]
MLKLDGRVALVTGSAHGIGQAYARRLAEDGASVVVVDLDETATQRAAAELRSRGFRALGVVADVSDPPATERMARSAIEAFGRVDILVNNAAMFSRVPMSRVPFEEIDVEEWDKMMAVNLRGTWLPCRAVVPGMRAGGYGKIVNISSSTVFSRSATRIHYVTTKAGIIGFTRTLAAELGAHNITVNCVAPGSTLSEEEGDADAVKFRSAAVSNRSLPRIQTPKDLVGAVSFFASPDSDFITGQTLVVDGGAVFH